jgi:hypothetical protein
MSEDEGCKNAERNKEKDARCQFPKSWNLEIAGMRRRLGETKPR